ncbi:MAG: NAD(P)H-dependent oxidoreductase subunit E [Clostridiales bacterium]|jgi:NADH:ubiquinone oxidoreductase subunit E|nr:NAD(P)H-dependent oxidoreductase subunit E [Clostridiales bacterium]
MSEFSSQLSELDAFIDGLDTLEGKLIVVLHKAQDVCGWLPAEVQNHIAHRLKVPASKVYGVVTFYSFFNTKPKGRCKISVCLGTACFVRGAQGIAEEFEKRLNIKVGETSGDKAYSLDSIRCVGACGLAPVVSVNGKVYGRVAPADVDGILNEHK